MANIRRKLHLPTRDAYEDAVVVTTVLLLCACIIFMCLALITTTWTFALWTFALLLTSVAGVILVAFVIENKKTKG